MKDPYCSSCHELLSLEPSNWIEVPLEFRNVCYECYLEMFV
jgi:hypothetical protein